MWRCTPIFRSRSYITSGLSGEEHAAYRALTESADAADFKRVVESGDRETDDVVRDCCRTVIQLMVDKNPQFYEMIRKDSLGCTPEQAMDLLRIPESERSAYASLVGGQRQ
jgi:hypothetical protein